MKYSDSTLDIKLRNWFCKDFSKALLRGIILSVGELRGLNSLDVSLNYPISAFAGKNGAGKSTIMALACCAYHNKRTGYRLKRRKYPYYTFSDFFVQHSDEISPQGITILYDIASDTGRKGEGDRDDFGIVRQIRKKNKGGKWNDYDTRIKRNVVFLGIERIVPHSERSQSRSYSRAFHATPKTGWENNVKDAVGNILGKTYDELRYLEHSKYSMPTVRCGEIFYSGFNMGAGENALFEIFSTIYACGEGGLLVIDEIELGLHVEAQKRFIEKLKQVCLETRTQVICTTHSREILECLPLDARFFVESVGGRTRVTPGVSSEFAFHKLSGLATGEITILVEDAVAAELLLAVLPAAIRLRISIKIIGSASALARQLAAAYVRDKSRKMLAIFDGDQRGKENDNLQHAVNMAENPALDFREWFLKRVDYLPGSVWPEAWIIQRCLEHVEYLSSLVLCDAVELQECLRNGLLQERHKEIYMVANSLGLSKKQCLQHMALCISQNNKQDFEPIVKRLLGLLDV